MRITRDRWIATAVVLSTVLPAGPALGKPRVFSNMTQRQAMMVVKQDQLLVIDVAATWCGPCKYMDRTTWVDPLVELWFKHNGLAIQIMADKLPAVADKLHVNAYPTLIIFRNGQEVARQPGVKPTQELLTWLTGLTPATPQLARLRKTAGVDGGPEDKQARLAYAQALLLRNMDTEAAQQLAWLWGHLDQDQNEASSLADSMLATLIADAARADTQAVEVLAKYRDEQTPALTGPTTDVAALERWALLSNLIRQPQPVLDWFEKARQDPKAKTQIQAMLPWVEQALAIAGRWADLGNLHADPLSVVADRFADLQRTLSRVSKGASLTAAQARIEQVYDDFFQSTAKLYVGLLAAGRKDPARDLAQRVMKMDHGDMAALWLVRTALDAGFPLAEHRAWLQWAATQGADDNMVRWLSGRLDKALTASNVQ
ncbi:MAG: hypothetical protein IT442_02450 [Phycisphaeraceae bacterium]|nr:hypothetical protein [Phycisphaeraceae bacterium]